MNNNKTENSNQNSVSGSHDRFFRKSMSDPKVAKEFFESHLPANILESIDLKTLREEKGDFLDKYLKERRTDILYSVEFEKETGYIILHFEHQSISDYWMALRLLRYRMAIYENYLKDNPKSKYLPLIYNSVFYTGIKEYNAPRELWDLFNDRELAKSLFIDPYHLIELQKIEDKQLKQKLWSGIMQYMMKRIMVDDILPFLINIKPMLEEIAKENFDYIYTILCYTVEKAETIKKEEIIKIFQDVVTDDKKGSIMTIAEQFKEEGIQQGIQQGMRMDAKQGFQQGELKGEIKGINKVALNMLAEGQTLEYIAKVTGLTMDDIKKLQYQSN